MGTRTPSLINLRSQTTNANTHKVRPDTPRQARFPHRVTEAGHLPTVRTVRPQARLHQLRGNTQPHLADSTPAGRGGSTQSGHRPTDHSPSPRPHGQNRIPLRRQRTVRPQSRRRPASGEKAPEHSPRPGPRLSPSRAVQRRSEHAGQGRWPRGDHRATPPANAHLLGYIWEGGPGSFWDN